MNQFWTLFKLNFRLKYGLLEIRNLRRTDPKKAAKKIWLGVAAFIGIAYALGFYIFIADSIFQGAMLVGAQGILLTVALLAGQVVILFFGVFYMMGLYNTRDMELLASLPIPQGRVFASKYAMVLISEISTFAIFIAPILLIFGIRTGADWTFYLKGVLIVVFGPALPMAISALIAALLMRATALVRHKDLIAVIGGFVLFTGLMVGNFLLTSNMQRNPGDIFGNFMQNQVQLFTSIAAGFPPTAWAALGLTGAGLTGLGYLGLFAGVSLAAVLLVALFAGRIYYSGALAQLEAHKRRDAKYSVKGVGKARKPETAIFFKEWKIVLRSPMYALNSLFGIIMGPLLVVMLSVGGGGNLQALFNALSASGSSVVFALIATALMVFVGSINPASATFISREGKSAWLLNIVPVTAKAQVRGKYLAGCSMSFLGILTTATTAVFMLKIPFFSFLPGIVTALFASAAITSTSIVIDLLRPKLNWESEQQAIKQNMNAVFAMLILFALIIILGVLAYALISAQLSEPILWAILIAVSAVFAIVSYRAIMAMAEKGFEKLKS
ncbi:MAG: hypothetical protein Q8O09_04180 [Bacillota bacterium]|nr:hypothetical protein [Bacillota bacterium]